MLEKLQDNMVTSIEIIKYINLIEGGGIFWHNRCKVIDKKISNLISFEFVVILTGFLNEEVSKELSYFYTLFRMISLNSPFEGVLLRVELSSINWILTSFNSGDKGIPKHIL